MMQAMQKRVVDIESPYSGKTLKETIDNVRYARACVSDVLMHGEIPYASHLFFTQPGILDDSSSEERTLGIRIGKDLIQMVGQVAEVITGVYTDRGISKGMELGIELAKNYGRTIEYRSLGNGWEAAFLLRENKHAQKGVWMIRDGDSDR